MTDKELREKVEKIVFDAYGNERRAITAILDLIEKDREELAITQALASKFQDMQVESGDKIAELQAEIKRLKEEVTQSHYDTADWIRKYDELQAEVERLSKALEIKTIAFKGEFDEHVEDCKNYRAKLDVAREALEDIIALRHDNQNDAEPDDVEIAKQALERIS